MGRFDFFDLHVIDEDEHRSFPMRFASHEFDSMTHILSESTADLNAVGAAVASLEVGMGDISISVDQAKRPVLDPSNFQKMLGTMDVMPIPGKAAARKRVNQAATSPGATVEVKIDDSFPVSVSNESNNHIYKFAIES